MRKRSSLSSCINFCLILPKMFIWNEGRSRQNINNKIKLIEDWTLFWNSFWRVIGYRLHTCYLFLNLLLEAKPRQKYQTWLQPRTAHLSSYLKIRSIDTSRQRALSRMNRGFYFYGTAYFLRIITTRNREKR